MRKKLKKARQEAGMTQKQVSEHLNVTIRSYQRIESGEMLGSIRIWDALEDLFRIPQRELRLAVQRKEEAADRE
ncbi:MAG: helix-turn-helix domain-containing protein [Lachnospiraceae bacterium]